MFILVVYPQKENFARVQIHMATQRTITTSIAYPNAAPHIGYALELVQADFFARAGRMLGQRVYFQIGTDEHGLKIQRAAAAASQEPLPFVTEQSERFQSLAAVLGLSHDRFIRTTDADHHEIAQAVWKACQEAGDIYKAPYQAWYDVKEEAFLGSVEENPDPSVFGIDEKFIEKIDEENYFFKLSAYQDRLLSMLDSGELRVTPDHRAKEMRNLAASGLHDVSISRQKDRLDWGIPVPGDDEHVMYVWFDALTNYLTGCAGLQAGSLVTGERWENVRHCVGKDIQRFHILLWPAMLMSAGLPVPKEVFVHGFLTVDGKKMSKSVGNVVDPFEEIAKFGAPAVRWHLLKDVGPTEDSDYARAQLISSYNADLANTIGNLLNRVRNLVSKYAPEGPQPVAGHDDDAVQAVVDEARTRFMAVIEDDPRMAAQVLLELAAFGNQRVDDTKPWVLAKDPDQSNQLAMVLYDLAEILRVLAGMLALFVPEVGAQLAEKTFGSTPDYAATYGYVWPKQAWPSEAAILFPKYEDEAH